MTTPNQRSALAALDAVRPIVARLDVSRHQEDLAADLLEAWSGIETALRTLMGGSAQGGQALVAELRQRQQLTLEQAHALLEFLAARDRASRPEYRPTSADVSAARQAVQKLEAGLAPDTGAVAPLTSAPLPPPNDPAPAGPSSFGRPAVMRLGIPLLIIAAVLAGVFLWMANRETGLERGAAHYAAGRREAARGEFAKVTRDQPELALPHVYLGRIAREEGDLLTAQRELSTAIRLEPANAVAQREMGKVLLVAGNNDLARSFLVRAVSLAPEDRSAQGFLGCALARLGRTQEAGTWLNRAGTGEWTGCAAPMSAPPMRGP